MLDLFGTLLLAAATAAAPAARGAFVLTSTDIHVGRPIASAQVFDGMGCDGRNQSPQLSWMGAPAGTKTFAITVHDPDAPTGSGWWHWVVYDIPADDRPHRYVVTVYALNDRLSIPASATAAYVGFNIHAHTIGKATLMARYGR